MPLPAAWTAGAGKPKKAVAKPEPAEVKVVAVEPLPDAEPASGTREPAVVEPAAADPAEPEAAKLDGWSVQISSAKDEKLAWGTWNALKAKHDILADQKPVVLRWDPA